MATIIFVSIRKTPIANYSKEGGEN